MSTIRHLNETSLWTSFQSGSEDALTELMRRYTRPLAFYGRKMARNDELIQDCIQETFIQLWQYRANLRQITEIRPYLFTCLRRKIIGSLKKEVFSEPVDDDLFSPFCIDFSIEERLIENENEAYRVRVLNKLINSLSKKRKEVIYLKFYENLSNNEIAEVMGIKYQTATNLIHEALDALRELIPGQSIVSLLILWFSFTLP
ncbi:hypothetical protein DYBT9275_00796 [Dyadobacter sp. CECT 9275]|uniref:Sigma-70 family RNA polymerase sigma factor n=1 Tax=Dyadobacter helix TaxID=2822344 RepID=A0A916J9A8_9BACT|nr:sigma-70 family RNA polymerase sigma factor [Dyadobacter sp. CECT 9275]CAG4991634.1 hypothetical protein DYBT9275_00796 [Dyadobacter sp. CECT 9275]